MTSLASLPMLNPQPLGASWECYPGSSSFGVLWRAARLNMLQRSDLRAILHVTLRCNDDIFARMTHAESQHAALFYTFPQLSHCSLWRVEDWWPFGGQVPNDVMPWRLRVCAMCARSCYHSLLFQMPGVHVCPWHRVELTDTCPCCARDLLVGFRDGLPIGQCPCGHDLVNFVATAEGESETLQSKRSALDAYHEWSAASRRINHLLAPEAWDGSAWDAMDTLISSKAHNPMTATSDVLLEDINLDRSLKFESGRLGHKSGLDSFKPGMVALPIAWFGPFRKIGQQLLALLPSSALARVSAPSGLVRQALGQLPAYPCGRHVYIDTESLERSVLRTGCRLAAALPGSSDGRPSKDKSLAWRVQQHPLGKRLVERTIQRVLTRGYADGVRIALGRQVPALFAHPRACPVRRYAWVLLTLPDGLVPKARIAWTRQRGTN